MGFEGFRSNVHPRFKKLIRIIGFKNPMIHQDQSRTIGVFIYSKRKDTGIFRKIGKNIFQPNCIRQL